MNIPSQTTGDRHMMLTEDKEQKLGNRLRHSWHLMRGVVHNRKHNSSSSNQADCGLNAKQLQYKEFGTQNNWCTLMGKQQSYESIITMARIITKMYIL